MKDAAHNQDAPGGTATTASVRSEIQEYLDIRQQRRWIFPRAALVGVFAGIAALLFRAALTGADVFRNGLIAWAQGMPLLGWVFPVGFAVLGRHFPSQ